ncbi:MAG: polyprenyl synthetase family protein [Fibrobacterales bacterium]
MNESAQRALDYLKRVGSLCEAKFDEHMSGGGIRPKRLHDAMRYSMFAGGKRLRPGLAYAAFEACGGTGNDIFYVTSALEMFHTFSLIHDDLPCMDDDDFRRGKPTAHKQYDEATAVLSGDALCILAFELLAKTGNIETVSVMAKALGTFGMIGGQIIDIESEGKKVDLDTVNYIHYHKTAALIEASILSGGLVAGISESDKKALLEYGNHIGLAFQIVDDILDIESTTEQLGKDVGSDIEKGKATYPAILGMDESKKRVKEHHAKAIECLDALSIDKTILKDIADFIITRVY